MRDTKITVVYDNTCTTCNALRSVGEKFDTSGNLDFVGQHSPHGEELVHQHGLDMQKSAYAIAPDGTVLEKSDMVHTVLSNTNIFGKFLALCARALPKSVADRLYDFVSKHRGH